MQKEGWVAKMAVVIRKEISVEVLCERGWVSTPVVQIENFCGRFMQCKGWVVQNCHNHENSNILAYMSRIFRLS